MALFRTAIKTDSVFLIMLFNEEFTFVVTWIIHAVVFVSIFVF